MEANWAERIAAFFSSPSTFLSCSSAEGFLAELLRELRDDRASYNLKVLLLSPLCQYPELLCPGLSAGEETALELTSVFAHCPPSSLEFRCHLLVALTSVLVCSGCAGARSRASRDFLSLLLGLAAGGGDPGDPHHDDGLRAAACDCLRELEACFPGVLSQHLELLSGLRQQATSRLHRALAGLHALALRNAVHLLACRRESGGGGGGPGELRALLAGGDALPVWEEGATPDMDPGEELCPTPPPPTFTLGAAGRVPTLRPGAECKELRSLLTALLDESYLLGPLAQAALLHGLVEVVAMVPGVSPTVFRAQLLRLLGTSKVCLLHTTLLMKAAFTDSLFSAEDEAFLLRRLVGLCQHPLLSAHEKLFYVHCLLHFPENRPVADDDYGGSPPVLLTPRLAAAVAPTVFDDTATMLARFHLAALVHLEAGVEAGDGARGLAYLYDHLGLLRRLAENRGSREKAVTFFRAAFLFLLHFHQVAPYAEALVADLRDLYRRRPRLAPHLLNLADRAGAGRLQEAGWAAALLRALQGAAVDAPLPSTNLRRHLAVLARVAEEGEVCQTPTLSFLSRVLASPCSSSSTSPGEEWRLGNGVLAVCRRLLVHPVRPDALFGPLADVLQRLALCSSDVDVRDRARLYYALLTTLSRDKLAGVLGGGGQARRCPLLPLVVVAEESQQLVSTLTVRDAPGPLLELRLDELLDGGPRESPAPGLEGSGLQPGQGALEAYRAQLHRPDFCADVVLRYRLAHTDAPHPPDPRFQQLFSLALHFQRTDEHYEEVADVGVLRAFRDAAAPLVSVRLTPRRPRPTTLRVAATFSTGDGATWRTPLPDLHVAFQQTFAPAPVPDGWAPADRLQLFRELWAEIAAGEAGGREGAISLFCSEPGEQLPTAWADRHFGPYLVEDPAHADRRKALLFLPPRSHLLLEICSEEDAVLQVHVATDTWQLLPHINSFLLAITDEGDR